MQIKLAFFVIIVLLLLGGFFYYQKVSSDEYLISKAIEQKLSTNSSVSSFTISDLRTKDGFAKAKITATDLDPAEVILQKKEGKWEAIWGPATGTSANDPIFNIVPKDL